MLYNKYRAILRANPLFASAINLMASAGVSALFGFIFWIVVARSFNSESVGLATTLLSVSALISLLGMAGFDTVFVRFLPKSEHRNETINGGLIISAIATTVISLGFCLIAPLITPKIGFLSANVWNILAFVIFTIFGTWNVLTNAVLVAYRRTSFVIVINIIFSAVKMVLPFVIKDGGALVIFAFMGIAQVVNVALSVAALMKYYDYRPSLRINYEPIKKLRKYGSVVYFAHMTNLLPDSILPLIVVDKLGAPSAAYFYIAFTIANLLYTIAFATTQALLAEASHEEDRIREHFGKAIKLTSALLVPISVVIIVVCPLVLSFFGDGYKGGATSLLRILSLSGLAVMAYSGLGTLFKLTHDFRALMVTNATNAISIIGLAFVFVGPWGLNGIGWAWLIGNVVSVASGGYYSLRWLRQR
ncbi:MAG: polysaccharide biosynthesis protein [Candidatus Saccharibacteria bacterium]|nr:polysaccharide biosynthesis protein [Candidatus Saccharibacteria bacterium]